MPNRMEPIGLMPSTQNPREYQNPNQGYSMMDENPGYDQSPEAKIAMLSNAFKNARGEDRRALFNEAFKIARQNKLEVFDWATGPIAVQLAEHTQKAVEAAKQASQIASAMKSRIDKSDAHVSDRTKFEYEMEQTASSAPFGRSVPMPDTVLDYQKETIQKDPQTLGYHFGDVIQAMLGKKKFNI